jgi:CBS domain-containing membrane protein
MLRGSFLRFVLGICLYWLLAVLLFGVPASPLAQPWSIVGGNLVAALIGVTAAHWIPSPLIAAAVAIGVTLSAMSSLRCVRPPSGAVALTAVLGGPHILALGYGFVLVPVGLNSLLLTLGAIVYNTLQADPIRIMRMFRLIRIRHSPRSPSHQLNSMR